MKTISYLLTKYSIIKNLITLNPPVNTKQKGLIKISQPKIPETDLKGSLTDLLESIALEEVSLAHFINAEAEKIQRIVEDCSVSSQMMLKFHLSV